MEGGTSRSPAAPSPKTKRTLRMSTRTNNENLEASIGPSVNQQKKMSDARDQTAPSDAALIRLPKSIYRLWMKFAHLIGRINTVILLTLFYIVFLGVTKLAAVLLRKDLLDQSWRDRPSYWKPRKDFKLSKEAFLKPY